MASRRTDPTTTPSSAVITSGFVVTRFKTAEVTEPVLKWMMSGATRVVDKVKNGMCMCRGDDAAFNAAS